MLGNLSCFKSLTRNVVSDNDLFPITNIENLLPDVLVWQLVKLVNLVKINCDGSI